MTSSIRIVQKTGPLVQLNIPVIRLLRQIPDQQELDNLIKNFGTKVIHTYMLPIHNIK